MSYSRWGSSRWYTFWCTQDEETENRDTAIFQICACRSFTAKELRDDINKCLELAGITENENCNMKHQIKDGDLDELKSYMKRFLKNVDGAYPKKDL